MTPHAILSGMTAAGFQISARGDKLIVSPSSRLNDQIRGLLLANKPALLELLQGGGDPPPPLNQEAHAAIQEAMDERAAIREYEGGEPRPVAEREARAAMRVYDALVAMSDGPPVWVTCLMPGCELKEARRSAALQFGPARLLAFNRHHKRLAVMEPIRAAHREATP